MRLFVAVELDAAMRRAAMQTQQALADGLERGRMTRAENLHLTLAFLGELPPSRVAAARRAMERAAAGSFALETEAVGRFRRREGDLIWLGLARTPGLLSLAARLDEALRAEGFALEQRAFTPHLTLVRQASCRRDWHPACCTPPHQCQTVREISLMESTRPNGVLTYTPLCRVALD